MDQSTPLSFAVVVSDKQPYPRVIKPGHSSFSTKFQNILPFGYDHSRIWFICWKTCSSLGTICHQSKS